MAILSKIIEGDCLDVMKSMADNSISCIVTDPPYGLGFMGKKWDAGLPHDEIWKEALRVVKPGGYILAFGGTRTYHRLTCSIEDAGWEIRDCIMWIYGSGFPKSHNHFGLEGYGTALKPAHEPIIMAMKPCDGTFANNAEKWGHAGINIDACRVGEGGGTKRSSQAEYPKNLDGTQDRSHHWARVGHHIDNTHKGRWPANVILDEEAGKVLDEQSGNLKSGKLEPYNRISDNYYSGSWPNSNFKSESSQGGASRFFYCAKASSSERNEGLEGLEDKLIDKSHYASPRLNDLRMENEQNRLPKKNSHPTVKPLKLMEYLIKLVMPPKDGVLLDPFAGSGSTIVAAQRLGFKAIGIEKHPEYCEIARARLENCEAEKEKPQLDLFKDKEGVC